ncbi:MAG TPA: hypothetical protein IAA61_11685 [Candidatus Ornithomonoglobus merdipullorum]|uniref:Copper amine oxidase-like N-terminal domain-containing protein n=1 Tax=Candidatus Ornithomonoglobus merdipullorum TaxID=2840895 RepID=A0A9D1MDU7_9FIRM|nr:hypothetical protein [Candidatus Ornithomonoglobus merdipullorum]
MKRKIISIILAAAAAMAIQPGVFAANENWRDAFVTRLMREIAQDPTYTDVVLTDLDRNGIPEAFVVKKGTYGNIGCGFTMTDNAITEIEVPQNIIGECLENIDVYIKNDNYIFVGHEVPRYSSYIAYYKLEFNGSAMTATRINKLDVSPYTNVTYIDKYSNNLLENGYPNRTKIEDFISRYDVVNNLSAAPSEARVLVNGEETGVVGYTVNDTNYFRIRDVAMVLVGTSCEFNIDWNAEDNGINIVPGEEYEPNGTELSSDTVGQIEAVENDMPIYVNGRSTAITAYNINGDAYFKIRDIADAAGFEVQWDGDSQTINLVTP